MYRCAYRQGQGVELIVWQASKQARSKEQGARERVDMVFDSLAVSQSVRQAGESV